MGLEVATFFEAVMLICFGSAWPLSIIKTLQVRSSKGKSFLFMGIIFTGYVSGIIFKILGKLDWVILLYLFNAILVAIDISLSWRFREKR